MKKGKIKTCLLLILHQDNQRGAFSGNEGPILCVAMSCLIMLLFQFYVKIEKMFENTRCIEIVFHHVIRGSSIMIH